MMLRIRMLVMSLLVALPAAALVTYAIDRGRAADQQLALERGEVVGVMRIAFATRLLEYRRPALAHQQHATGRVADHCGNDADVPVFTAHRRENDHDCMRPFLYRITPWNGRGSSSNPRAATTSAIAAPIS